MTYRQPQAEVVLPYVVYFRGFVKSDVRLMPLRLGRARRRNSKWLIRTDRAKHAIPRLAFLHRLAAGRPLHTHPPPPGCFTPAPLSYAHNSRDQRGNWPSA
jgi:hypothetical protein